MADYDIGAAFERIEDELISSMIRNFKRHKAEETKEGIQWTQWQAEQLKALEDYKRQNAKKFKKQFRSINNQLEKAIRAANAEGGMEQEAALMRAARKGARVWEPSNSLSGSFFKLNERKLDTLVNATKHDMERAETAVLRMANDQYRKIIYSAQVYATTGAGTYAKAVDMATKDFLAAGINCIEYKNGRRVNIKSYAEMALRTANKRAYLQGEGTKRQEWGVSTVILNKRANSCPLCAKHVGKVYIDDVWSGGAKDGISNVTGLKYPLLSEAMASGLYHPNCKDSHTTYFEGINTVPEDGEYTTDELNDIADKYAAEQKQRYAEGQAKKCDRLAKYSLDPDNQRKYGARAEQWRERLEPPKNVITGEFESSKTKVTNSYSVIDKHIINSPDYRKTFDKLSEEPKITRSIFQQVKAILTHRSGGNFEDLSFIDSITGKFLTRTDYNVKSQCIPSKRMMRMVRKAKPNTIIAIHNHPNSSVPSLNDINNAWKKKYKYGIIACHNGNLYKYRVTGEYDDIKVSFALDRLNRAIYNKGAIDYQKKIDKALAELRKNNIDMEVFLWE